MLKYLKLVFALLRSLAGKVEHTQSTSEHTHTGIDLGTIVLGEYEYIKLNR